MVQLLPPFLDTSAWVIVIAAQSRPLHETVCTLVAPTGSGICFHDLPTLVLKKAMPAVYSEFSPTATHDVEVPHATALMYAFLAGKPAFDQDFPAFVVTSPREISVLELDFIEPSATHDVAVAHAVALLREYTASSSTAQDFPPVLDTMIALEECGPGGPFVEVAMQRSGEPHETLLASPTEPGTAAAFHEAPTFVDTNALAGSSPPQPPTEHFDASATHPVPLHATDFSG